MAEIKFSCPHCRQKIQCDASHSGSRINCPACQQSILVPASTIAPAGPSGERTIQIKVRTLKKAALTALAVLSVAGIVLVGNAVFNKRTVLKGNDRLDSPQRLRPPVEIT